MCDKCDLARLRALPSMLNGLHDSGIAGAELLASLALTALTANPENEAVRRQRVDDLMLDSYDTQRKEALAIAGWIVAHFTAIKTRLQHEIISAGDTGGVVAQWDGERKGFVLRTRDEIGNALESFYPVVEGESVPEALMRILNEYVAGGGELHEE